MATFATLDTVGDTISSIVDLIGIVWTGGTTASDICALKEVNGEIFWEGRADGTDTYVGIRFPDEGIHLTRGIEVSAISAGKVFLYFRDA